jgi:DNA helicase-2/ATP-dependent DNA helicase PcrA
VDAEALLADLTLAQRVAVSSEHQPLAILAGAGAGKTRVLTGRIAYRIATGTAGAGHVLALTFTRKAAGELVDRLRGLGVREQVASGTFHAVAYAQLRRYWADRGQAPPALLDRKARILTTLVRDRPQLAGASIAELAAEIEWAKARLVRPDGYQAAAGEIGRRPPAPPAAVAALFARYEAEKIRRGLVDFDDLLAGCATAIEQDPRFGAAQRWRWRHFFVDEFQDVNPLQHRLLVAWLGGRADLCVVGDPNQAIYSWNGADPGLLSDIAASWPGVEVLRLDDNHRCTPQVVRTASAVLGAGAPPAQATRPDGPEPEVRSYPTDAAEAAGVAAGLRRARSTGLAWSHLAVLVRTHAQVPVFETTLQAAGIPFRLAGGGALLDHREVRGLLAELGRARSRHAVATFAADLEVLVRESPEPTGDDRADALLALLALVREFQRLDPDGTGEAFVAWLRATTAQERGDRETGTVTISSFHRAKGLEWPAVWIAGLEDGLVPIRHAGSPAAVDEERRLLYVAITRAQREVHFSWAERRSFGGRPVPRRPSPWLAAVEGSAHPAGPGGALGPGGFPARLADQRHRLRVQPRGRGAGDPRLASGRAAVAEPDPVIVEALRTWRTNTARAAGVPAYVLLHDSTLAAIAAARPTTADELLAIPGMGPVKVSRLGPTLLELVARHPASA